jgi:uncharacterized protein (DUF2384 family)
VAFRKAVQSSRAGFASTHAQNTVEWATTELELGIDEVAAAVGASRRTVHRWQAAEAPPSPEHRKKLEELQQLRHLLGEVFRTPDSALEWVHSPVPALGGKTPLLVLTEGHASRLVQLLAGIRTGAHT